MKKTTKHIKTWRNESDFFRKMTIKTLTKYAANNGNFPCGSVFVFDKGERHAGFECEEVIKGRVYLSDYGSGIIEWCSEKKQYLHMYRMHETPLGQLKAIYAPRAKHIMRDLLRQSCRYCGFDGTPSAYWPSVSVRCSNKQCGASAPLNTWEK
jgi:hypothetical protein